LWSKKGKSGGRIGRGVGKKGSPIWWSDENAVDGKPRVYKNNTYSAKGGKKTAERGF